MKGLRSKRRYQMIVAICLVVLISAGFYMKTRPIYIGFIGGLSGHWSQLGVQARDGFLVAIEDVNAQGGIRGRKLVPIILDDRNDNDYAHYLLEEMAAKNVQFIVGFTVSAMAPTIKAHGQDASKLFVSPTMSTNELAGVDDYFIRVCNPSQLEAHAITDGLLGEQLKDVAIVYDMSNQPYTEPTKELIEKEAFERGLNIVYTEAYYSKNVYFEEIVKRLIDQDPDQIVVLASATDTAEITQRLKANGSRAILYASAWATTNDLLGLGGSTLENVRVVGLCDVDSEAANFIAFKEKLMNQYGKETNFPQIYGYEAMMLLKNGIYKSGSMDPVKVKEAIIEQGYFEGLQEQIEIDAYGDANRPYYLYVIKDGEFHHIN